MPLMELEAYLDLLWTERGYRRNDANNESKIFRDRIPWNNEIIHFDLKTIEEIVGATQSGLICEFGTHGGASLQKICSATTETVYGFDSFEGIPEPWALFRKGYWALPNHDEIEWPENAEIIAGWFADTLPGFMAGHPGPIAYAHINSGLYSSARDVLTNIADRIVIGTILHFGEIKMYPDSDQERRAFNEYLAEYGGEWEAFAETNYFDTAFRKLAQ